MHLELKPEAKPFCAISYRISHSITKLMKNEMDRLVEIGVLKKVSASEWVALSFRVPKKGGEIRFVSDFRGLNKRLVRKSHLRPKIEKNHGMHRRFQMGNMLRPKYGILEHGVRQREPRVLCHSSSMEHICIPSATHGVIVISRHLSSSDEHLVP